MTYALAIGTCTKNKDGKIIEAYFPSPQLNPAAEEVNNIAAIVDYTGGNCAIEINNAQADTLAPLFADATQQQFAQAAANATATLVLVILENDDKPSSVAEGFLKLQLISHRLVKPHATVLDGIFGLLHNIAWTNQGAIDLPELTERQMQARLKGETLTVDCVDKFPKMSNYIVPTGVRIAHTARVRLGAHIGEGTTIMHEGFVNFNAGTEGVSMVEGRISAGVMVGNNSDIGGGASILGTLSGGGSIVVSLGENCLLGANAGTGIPLGDRCTIEAGLYVTAGTKVSMLDANKQVVETVKARELAGKSDLLFIRNSLSGEVQCLTNKSAIELNEELHANN